MATQFWRGTAIKRHFSSWGAGRISRSWGAARASKRISPGVEQAARHSDYPDVSTYDRPATTRMTPANLGLSIVLLVIALVVFGVILWTVFR
jgi:hypothetical protein